MQVALFFIVNCVGLTPMLHGLLNFVPIQGLTPYASRLKNLSGYFDLGYSHVHVPSSHSSGAICCAASENQLTCRNEMVSHP